MKWLLGALFAALLPAAAWAQVTCPNVPYAFVNGATADGGQVNANFAAMIACFANIKGAQHVVDNTALAAASTATYPLGVWRDSYAANSGAPPQFFTVQGGACAQQSPAQPNDGGNCVDAADGNSWHGWPSAAGWDAREFGWSASAAGASNRTNLQNAINAAYNLAPGGAKVLIPVGGNADSYIYVPNNITLQCGGAQGTITRDTVGALFVTVVKPGDTYATGVTTGFAMQDCTIDNDQLAGTGLVIHIGSGWKLTRTSFINGIPGAEFAAHVSGTTLTIDHLTQGTIHVGDFVVGAELSAIFANTFPSISSGSGPYTLSGTYGSPISSEEMISVTPWTWTNGPPAPANTTFPSADVSLLGGVFDGQWNTGYVGGSYDSTFSTCAKTSAIGLYADSDLTTGSGKPNFNLFQNIYNLCSNLGVLGANGSNNTLIQIDHEFDNIDEMWGTGIVNAYGNFVIQPYFEGRGAGQSVGDTRMAVVWDVNAHDNIVTGAGSFDSVDAPAQNVGQRNVMQYTGRTTVNGIGVPRGAAIAGDECLYWQQTGSGVAPVISICEDASSVIDFGNGTYQDTSAQLKTAGIVGFTNGASAAAGVVGEEGSQAGSGTAAASGTAFTAASKSLGAGDYDVCGTIQFGAPGTSGTSWQSGLSTTAATQPATLGDTIDATHGPMQLLNSAAIASGQTMGSGCGHLLVGGATTVYLVGTENYTGAAPPYSAVLRWRRLH